VASVEKRCCTDEAEKILLSLVAVTASEGGDSMDPKQAIFVGLGWLERSQERIEELVEELIERGELSRKDSKRFIKQIMEQARGEKEEFRRVVQEILRDALGSAGVATTEDMNELNARLDSIEKKVKKMAQGKAKPSAGSGKKNRPAGKSSGKGV
jgi:polyhydroxyalkanoate synthesis regulator phasin